MKRPRLAVLAVALQGDDVLLVQRRNPPDAELWGYPGGHVEWGETLEQAALRELHEETGLTGQTLARLAPIEFLDGTGPDTRHHFLMMPILCQTPGETPTAQDDAIAAAWVPIGAVITGSLPLSAHVADLLHHARRAVANPNAAPPSSL